MFGTKVVEKNTAKRAYNGIVKYRHFFPFQAASHSHKYLTVDPRD